LNKNTSPVSEFNVEFLAGSKDVVFGPGSIIQGMTQTTTFDPMTNLR
jgi:hypothetical protein